MRVGEKDRRKKSERSVERENDRRGERGRVRNRFELEVGGVAGGRGVRTWNQGIGGTGNSRGRENWNPE